MGINQTKMLGDGPYPLPMEDFIKAVTICMDTDICVIMPKSGIDFPEKAQHTHDSYEFTIPFDTIPYLSLEKVRHSALEGRILPINSGVAHGPYKRMLNKRFISLSVDNDFLNEIAYSIYGKANVLFELDDYVFGDALEMLMRMFVEEYTNTQPGRRLVLKSLSTQIVASLLRQIKTNMPILTSSDCSTSKKNIDRVIEYLRDQYDSEYSLEEAAELAHLSPYHFIRVFKSYTGKTPYEYLLYLKTAKAKELLTSQLSITEICYVCGFNSLSNFCTFFKRKVGVTPSQYRKIIMSN